ncbi:MAG TPA: ABC transporter permease [Candidatus Dormibacteraeota bacterium]|jgi:phospholipid/cholesterol/gamma-HCH transport system permease protein|nr:ABC transporter permease [Candidatus Dormibacteraeota bacterium]
MLRAVLRGVVARPFYFDEFLDQSKFILFACFVPLLLTGVGWGTIVSLQAGHFFKVAQAGYRLGGFSVMANIREFAPTATALMVAAVAGTAITADLGARQVRQELEALSVMGMSNINFIVVPRFLAMVVMTALYNIPMVAFCVAAGFGVAVFIVGVNPGAFLSTFWTQGTLLDLYGGEIKCLLFGAIVSSVACYKGITARGGAEGVARAVHQSVVVNFVAILGMNYLYTATILAASHANNVLK